MFSKNQTARIFISTVFTISILFSTVIPAGAVFAQSNTDNTLGENTDVGATLGITEGDVTEENSNTNVNTNDIEDTNSNTSEISDDTIDDVGEEATDLTHTCVTLNSLSDTTVESIVHGSDAVSLQDVFNAKGIAKNVISDQKQYQVLNFNNASTTFTFEFISRTASYSSAFGYYTVGNVGSFTPVFNSGVAAEGFATSTTVLGAGNLGFAIKVVETSDTWGSENILNTSSADQAAFYELADNTFVIAFEDLPYASSDKDYNDLLVKVTVNCSQTPVEPPPPSQCTIDIFSDTTNQVQGGSNAVATYSSNSRWTASIPGATWIWKTFLVTDPSIEQFETFTKTFTLASSSAVTSASLVMAADNSYTVSVNDTQVGADATEFNYFEEGKDTYNVAPYLHTGSNTLSFTVKNWAVASSSPEENPAGLLYKLHITAVDGNCGGGPIDPPVNPTPTVTLTASPTSLTSSGTSTLSWISTNTTSCSAPWTTATSTSGNQIVSLASTTDYGITCTGSYGSVSATTTITISSTTPPGDGGGGGGGNGGGGSSSGGGGGGGSSSSGGRRHDITSATPVGEVLGVSTTCSYLRDFLRRDWDNDKIEMLKLQTFLNAFEKENISLTATFDQATFEAVSRFQNKYFSDILEPWGHTAPTGFVYILTKKKINEIYCNTLLSLNQNERDEIAAFRAFLKSYPSSDVGGYVGSIDSSGNYVGGDASLEDGSSVVDLTDESDKDMSDSILRNAAVSLFGAPQKIFSNIKYLLIFLIILAVLITVIRWLLGSDTDSGDNDNTTLHNSDNATETTVEAPPKLVENTPPPVINLPPSGSTYGEVPDVLPGEELIIESPEEQVEE